MQGLAWALLVAGCSPAVDAEFPRIEVTRPDIVIPPVPTSAPSSVIFTFSLDSTSLGASTNPDAQNRVVSAELHRLSFTAKSGVTDVSFIQSMHAMACVPVTKTSTQSARQVEIADYVRQGAATPSATFEVPILEPVDLLPLLRLSKNEPRRILAIINLGGSLPTSEWKVDVNMSLSVELRQ
jgi:hypothetical protein